MDGVRERVERALASAFSEGEAPLGPPRLADALRYAVFPGGGRVRPCLTLMVARSLGDPDRELSDAAAAAVELIHCASLVHDDLPCFDSATLRRGRPTVHVAFGEATALLTGDALLILAFETLARVRGPGRSRALGMVGVLAGAAGHPRGLVAGQGWEAEPAVSLATYHRAKTASLFGAAAAMGALATGHDPGPFREVGEHLGSAYQLADDLADVIGTTATLGKNVGVDARMCRPTALAGRSREACRSDVESALDAARAAVPDVAGRSDLRRWIGAAGARLLLHTRVEAARETSEEPAARG